MSLTLRTSIPQMPLEIGMPIDPVTRKTLQDRIRSLLHAKTDKFPGSYPVPFEPSHLQLLANEEYFVLEKVAGIDRHYEISFVPHLLLPLRDNPTKYQNETLLDGEMVVENDGSKMMDQDVIAVQTSKANEVKAKEPFTIERKIMQRSYGLNVILAGSKRHKHGGEGLIFAPVKQPYVPGTSPKLLKWKSHTTAQFLIKVSMSKERKPLYCIHVKQGTGSKFHDYVTPEPALALEWHNSSPDGKIAEFWWDPQWPTQMFEKGYGLETRTGGWRFYRIRDDKKDIDDETAVLALVKGTETIVTKEQLESQIDHIRTQWKAREAGASSNGSAASSSHPAQPRPPVRPLSINSTHPESHPPPLTPSLSSHYLQSPSVSSHSGSLGYFSRRDREHKSSMDDHGSSNSQPTAISGAFSHPLPPKPQPVQSRQSSTDQTPSQSAAAAISSAKTSEQDHSSSPSSANSSATSVTQASSNKLTPPPTGTPAGTSSAPASSSPPSATIAKNPLKLSQVPEHLQPIKSWMTVSPIPRAPLGDKGTKTFRGERRDSRDSIAGSTSPRSTSSVSRKSSLSVTESAKEVPATPAVATAPKVADIAEDSTNVMESVSVAAQRASSAAHENQPQTPTPAHTPTPAGTSRSAVPLALPPTLSYPPVNVSPPNLILSNEEEKTTDVQQIVGDSTPDGKSQSAPAAALITSAPIKTSAQDAEPSVLGKRTVALSLSADDRSEDTFTRRRKLSDGALPSRKMESSVTDIETPQPTPAQPLNPTSSSPLAPPNMSPHVTKRSPLLSPLSSPGAVAVGPADRQPSRLLDSPDHSAIADTRSFNDVSQHQDSTPAESDVSRFGEESAYVKIEPIMPKKSNQRMKQEPFVAALGENVEVTNIAGSTAVTTGPLPTPALTMAEQMAYQAPTNQEKALVMARARSAMMSRLEIQMEEQAAKETKMAEDIERFKKMSRLRKEKAQKRKLQEANEAPVQDRRAQPVRLINQQQGRQSNSDSPSLRSQTQGTQRQGSSPQDQQRLSYTTRQSKAASRIETQQSAQNSPRTQSRSAQYSGQQKGLNQSLGDPAPQPPTQRDQRTMPSESDSPNQGRIDQQASGVPNSNLRPPEETVRLHRRINSMDHHLRTSQSLNSLRPDPTAPDQRELAEQLYGQPHSKRLDLGQHGETNHRRSHSDVGVLYKPVVTAIVQPQPTAREHPQTAARRDFPPIHHNPRVNKHDMEYFQSVYSPQGLGGPAPFQSDVDGARMRGNSAFTSGANEAALAKRESKTRLQFILNDEDSEPESRSDEDFPSREAPHWGQRNPSQEHPQRGNAASMEYGGRSSYAHEYSVPGHRGMHVGPGTPPSVVDPNMTRHQQAKKQKLSQELIGMGQHVNTRTEEYEHQLRKAQIQSQSPRTVAPPSQRGGPQADRWTQQAHAQYPAPPPHMHTKSPSQPLPSGRRVSGEAPLMTPQLISHPPSRSMYSGAEQPQHGNPPTNRAVHHDQYPHPGSATAQESPRPNPDRPTHSRHSSLSKPGIVPPEHGHSHGSPHQGGRVKSSQVQPEHHKRLDNIVESIMTKFQPQATRVIMNKRPMLGTLDQVVRPHMTLNRFIRPLRKKGRAHPTHHIMELVLLTIRPIAYTPGEAQGRL
ncbi:Dcp1p-Dcp2p decapping enzyme complex alpha subunit [Gamsiella multidivaricata]|nr:Dcp1p-Dcp2p decapping enzyme complex alpha subunit [Gamsiella multidivaricata]